MNKVAIATAVVASSLLVGLPPLLSSITETQVRARVAEISRSGVLTAEIRSYTRGWFRGRAKIDLGLSPAYARQLRAANDARGVPELGALAAQAAPLEVELAYGPIAILDGVSFGLSRMVARPDPESPAVANLEQSLGVPHLFEFRGRSGFFGKLSFDADVPPVDVAVQPTRVRFSGALFDGTLAGKRLVANGRVDRFEFSSPTGAFTLENATAKVDNEIRSQYVWPGNAGFSIGRLSIVDAQRGPTPVFDAAGVRVDSVVTLDESRNLLDVQASYALESAVVDGAQISDVSISTAFRKLDAATLEAYAAAMRGVATAGSAPSETAVRELRPAIERALAAGPSVALDPIRFKYNGEPFTARLEIETNAGVAAAGALDLDDPATLLTLFDTSANIEVSKKLAEELAVLALQARYADDPTIPPEQRTVQAEAESGLALVALVAGGFLEDAGDAYRSELRVTSGVVTVNGTELPFSGP